IANSPNFAGLDRLILQGWGNSLGRIGVEGAEAIARSAYLTRLHVLILFSCGIGDAGAAALAESPNLAKLTCLNLAENDLRDAAVDALVNSPYLPERFDTLPCLIPNNRITPAGQAALQARFDPPRQAIHRRSNSENIPF